MSERVSAIVVRLALSSSVGSGVIQTAGAVQLLGVALGGNGALFHNSERNSVVVCIHLCGKERNGRKSRRRRRIGLTYIVCWFDGGHYRRLLYSSEDYAVAFSV